MAQKEIENREIWQSFSTQRLDKMRLYLTRILEEAFKRNDNDSILMFTLKLKELEKEIQKRHED